MKIKNWILLIINSLVIFVILFISTSFYKEASKVIDKRILQHLYSIKTLKKIQLEKLIKKEWEEFEYLEKPNEIYLPRNKYLKNRIYDVTHLHPWTT